MTLKGKYNPTRKVETSKFEYSSDSYYEGEWIGGLRHGKGTLVERYYTYTGDWQFNWPHG